MNYILLTLILLPFAGFGVYKMINFLKTYILVRKGYFKAYFRTPNRRKISKLVKPDGDSIELKFSIMGKKRIYPFSDDIGYIYFDGNTPEVEYDLDGEQINFSDRKTDSKFDSQDLNTLAQRTFNAGKRAAESEDKYQKIATYIAAGASVFGVIILMGFIQNIDKIMASAVK